MILVSLPDLAPEPAALARALADVEHAGICALSEEAYRRWRAGEPEESAPEDENPS